MGSAAFHIGIIYLVLPKSSSVLKQFFLGLLHVLVKTVGLAELQSHLLLIAILVGIVYSEARA